MADWGQADFERPYASYAPWYPPVFRPVGADPAYCVGWFRTSTGRDSTFDAVGSLVLAVMFVYLAWMNLHIASTDGLAFNRLVGLLVVASIPLQLFRALSAYRGSRTRVETDPFGVTVVNRWRTHRFRWSDVDAVVFDGRRSITLLTRDRVVACDALTWQKRAPGSLRRAKSGLRQPLDAAAAWLAETLAYRSAYV